MRKCYLLPPVIPHKFLGLTGKVSRLFPQLKVKSPASGDEGKPNISELQVLPG